MRKSSTGGIQWQLKCNGDTAVTATPGTSKTFMCNDLPDRAPTGFLALYLTVLFLTLSGSVTQSGSTGAAIARDQMPRLLFDSINWDNSWMGRVLSSDFITGAMLPIVEFTSGGFMYGQRQFNQIPAANGTYNFKIKLALPALNDRRGRLVNETSHLALLFQPSNIKVNSAPNSTLTTFSTGASWGTQTLSLTAQLDPRPDLVLGTPMEWILHQQIATTTGSQVLIPGFGRNTQLTGVEAKGGVAFLAELCTLSGLGGVLSPNSITNFAFQWRGLAPTTDVDSWVDQFIAMMPAGRPLTSSGTDLATASRSEDYAGYPFPQSNVDASSTTLDLTNLNFFPWVMGGADLDLTELQTADSDQTYTINGGIAAGNHLQLAQYARVWQDTKRADWVAQILRGGASSLASYVLGGPAKVKAALDFANSFATKLPRREPLSKHLVTEDQRTYLPYTLVCPPGA